MVGKNATRLVGWHPSSASLVARLDAEIERRGGGRGAQSAILDEALTEYFEHRDGATRAPEVTTARVATTTAVPRGMHARNCKCGICQPKESKR